MIELSVVGPAQPHKITRWDAYLSEAGVLLGWLLTPWNYGVVFSTLPPAQREEIRGVATDLAVRQALKNFPDADDKEMLEHLLRCKNCQKLVFEIVLNHIRKAV